MFIILEQVTLELIWILTRIRRGKNKKLVEEITLKISDSKVGG